MSEIAVVGAPRFTLGFRLAGLRHVHDVHSDEELERAFLRAMNTEDVSVLVVATGDLERIDARLRDELLRSVTPTVVAVGTEEDNSLRQKIKQAVGVDLW